METKRSVIQHSVLCLETYEWKEMLNSVSASLVTITEGNKVITFNIRDEDFYENLEFASTEAAMDFGRDLFKIFIQNNLIKFIDPQTHKQHFHHDDNYKSALSDVGVDYGELSFHLFRDLSSKKYTLSSMCRMTGVNDIKIKDLEDVLIVTLYVGMETCIGRKKFFRDKVTIDGKDFYHDGCDSLWSNWYEANPQTLTIAFERKSKWSVS